MIQIDDVVISLDVFREKFLCDLGACKGECCIEGDQSSFEETIDAQQGTTAKRQWQQRPSLRGILPSGAKDRRWEGLVEGCHLLLFGSL